MFNKLKLYLKQRYCNHVFKFETEIKNYPFTVTQICACIKCGSSKIDNYTRLIMNEQVNELFKKNWIENK